MTQHPFFHNSLLFLEWISALVCLIKMTFGMSQRYAPGRFVFEFHENQMDDNVIFSNFIKTIVQISNSTKPTNFMLGTNIQHKVHLIIKVKMTMTDAEGQRSQK